MQSIIINRMHHNRTDMHNNLTEELYNKLKHISSAEHCLLDLEGEGYNLETSGFNKLLMFVTTLLNINPTHIHIMNANLISSVTPFTEIRTHIDNVTFAKPLQNTPHITKNITKCFGSFVYNTSFYRLVLSTWIYTYAKGNAIQSYHTFRKQQAGTVTEMLNLKQGTVTLRNIGAFINSAPLILNSINYNASQTQDWTLLSMHYENIFVDLVMETQTNDCVFFLTEKIFRPIALLTPFIVMGSVDFLKNLQAIGFKTFDRWWDESYDDLNGNDRLVAMCNVLTNLNKKTVDELKIMYNEMLPILEHNRQLMLDEPRLVNNINHFIDNN